MVFVLCIVGCLVVSTLSCSAPILLNAWAASSSRTSAGIPSGVGLILKYLNFDPPGEGERIISVSVLSMASKLSMGFPSVFHISNKPPTSSPTDLSGGPSILMTDLPSLLCPVIILRISFSFWRARRDSNSRPCGS